MRLRSVGQSGILLIFYNMSLCTAMLTQHICPKTAADIYVSGTKRHHVLTARGGTNELFVLAEARSLPSWLHWASMPVFLPRGAFEVLPILLLWVMRWLDASLWGSCPRPVEWHCVCHDRTGTARGVPRMSRKVSCFSAAHTTCISAMAVALLLEGH